MTLPALATFALLVAAATLRAFFAPARRARAASRAGLGMELPAPTVALDLAGMRTPAATLEAAGEKRR